MPTRPGKPLEPMDIVPYSTFLRPVPVPAAGFHDGEQICVTFSEEWRSYILGALEILRWRDMWDGSPEDVALTIDRVEELYAHFAAGSCTDMTSFYDIRGDGCTLEIKRTPEGSWEQIADFSACGAEGPQGEKGDQGDVGPQGDSADCGDCDATYSGEGPTETVELTDEANACGFAAGMAIWIHGEFESSLLLANQLFQAGRAISYIALQLFETIPIIGSFASAVRTFADFASTITFELLEYAESDEWHDWIREKAYCFFRQRMTVDLETMQDFKQYMIDESIFLPPQGPLLVLIGQPFAGFAAGWHPPTLQVRGAFYAQEESIDCIEFECPFDWVEDFLDGGGWHDEFEFRWGSEAFGEGCWGSHDPVLDRVDGCTPVPGSAVGTWFDLPLPVDTTITTIVAKVEWNRTRNYLTDNVFHVMSRDGEGEFVYHEMFQRAEGGVHVETFRWDGTISYGSGDGKLIPGGWCRNHNASDGSYWRLVKLSISGTGTNPFE